MSNNAVGGNDHLNVTGDNNLLYGDSVLFENAGADEFHFNGEADTNKIGDFRSSDGDKILIDGTALTWAELSGFIETGDFKSVGTPGDDTRIDLGGALGEGSSVILVAGVTDLQESDFLFV